MASSAGAPSPALPPYLNSSPARPSMPPPPPAGSIHTGPPSIAPPAPPLGGLQRPPSMGSSGAPRPPYGPSVPVPPPSLGALPPLPPGPPGGPMGAPRPPAPPPPVPGVLPSSVSPARPPGPPPPGPAPGPPHVPVPPPPAPHHQHAPASLPHPPHTEHGPPPAPDNHTALVVHHKYAKSDGSSDKDKAALAIQAHFRGSAARKALKEMAASGVLETMAQASVRARSGGEVASVNAQEYYTAGLRSSQDPLMMALMADDPAMAQRKAKHGKRKTPEAEEAEKKAAIKMQAAARGYLIRKAGVVGRVHSDKSATKAVALGHFAASTAASKAAEKNKEAEIEASCVAIQAAMRGYLARKSWKDSEGHTRVKAFKHAAEKTENTINREALLGVPDEITSAQAGAYFEKIVGAADRAGHTPEALLDRPVWGGQHARGQAAPALADAQASPLLLRNGSGTSTPDDARRQTAAAVRIQSVTRGRQARARAPAPRPPPTVPTAVPPAVPHPHSVLQQAVHVHAAAPRPPAVLAAAASPSLPSPALPRIVLPHVPHAPRPPALPLPAPGLGLGGAPRPQAGGAPRPPAPPLPLAPQGPDPTPHPPVETAVVSRAHVPDALPHVAAHAVPPGTHGVASATAREETSHQAWIRAHTGAVGDGVSSAGQEAYYMSGLRSYKKEDEAAAARIQSLYRGHAVRAQVKKAPTKAVAVGHYAASTAASARKADLVGTADDVTAAGSGEAYLGGRAVDVHGSAHVAHAVGTADQAERESAAAVRIQARVRGHAARKAAPRKDANKGLPASHAPTPAPPPPAPAQPLRTGLSDDEAATKIASAARARAARKKVAEMRRRAGVQDLSASTGNAHFGDGLRGRDVSLKGEEESNADGRRWVGAGMDGHHAVLVLDGPGIGAAVGKTHALGPVHSHSHGQAHVSEAHVAQAQEHAESVEAFAVAPPSVQVAGAAPLTPALVHLTLKEQRDVALHLGAAEAAHRLALLDAAGQLRGAVELEQAAEDRAREEAAIRIQAIVRGRQSRFVSGVKQSEAIASGLARERRERLATAYGGRAVGGEGHAGKSRAEKLAERKGVLQAEEDTELVYIGATMGLDTATTAKLVAAARASEGEEEDVGADAEYARRRAALALSDEQRAAAGVGVEQLSLALSAESNPRTGGDGAPALSQASLAQLDGPALASLAKLLVSLAVLGTASDGVKAFVQDALKSKGKKLRSMNLAPTPSRARPKGGEGAVMRAVQRSRAGSPNKAFAALYPVSGTTPTTSSTPSVRHPEATGGDTLSGMEEAARTLREESRDLKRKLASLQAGVAKAKAGATPHVNATAKSSGAPPRVPADDEVERVAGMYSVTMRKLTVVQRRLEQARARCGLSYAARSDGWIPGMGLAGSCVPARPAQTRSTSPSRDTPLEMRYTGHPFSYAEAVQALEEELACRAQGTGQEGSASVVADERASTRAGAGHLGMTVVRGGPERAGTYATRLFGRVYSPAYSPADPSTRQQALPTARLGAEQRHKGFATPTFASGMRDYRVDAEGLRAAAELQRSGSPRALRVAPISAAVPAGMGMSVGALSATVAPTIGTHTHYNLRGSAVKAGAGAGSPAADSAARSPSQTPVGAEEVSA